jgi:hypothetical protein
METCSKQDEGLLEQQNNVQCHGAGPIPNDWHCFGPYLIFTEHNCQPLRQTVCIPCNDNLGCTNRNQAYPCGLIMQINIGHSFYCRIWFSRFFRKVLLGS